MRGNVGAELSGTAAIANSNVTRLYWPIHYVTANRCANVAAESFGAQLVTIALLVVAGGGGGCIYWRRARCCSRNCVMDHRLLVTLY